MDNRAGVKRPRKGTPDKTSKMKEKSTKKKKKAKPTTKKGSESNDDNANSLESQPYMAKILSTFSKMEQSRFEAFKRVAFPADAISNYVAHCLAERQQHQRPDMNHHSKSLFAGIENESATQQQQQQQPKLKDLVVPGQEEEITTVVATLAKVYAQRLCAAAKAHAQSVAGSSNSADTTGTSSDGGGAGPLQPEHLLHAFYARKQQGQEPGFFLQPNEGITIPNNGKEQMKRVAALAAQEDFDRVLEECMEKEKKEEQQQQQSKGGTKKDGPTPMEEDSDSGDEEEVELDMENELEKEMSGGDAKKK